MRRIVYSAAICFVLLSVIFSGCSNRANWIDVDIDKKVFDDAEPVYNDDNNIYNSSRSNYKLNITRTEDAFYLIKFETRTDFDEFCDNSYKTIYRTDESGTKMVYDGLRTDFQGRDGYLQVYDGKLLDTSVHEESGEQEVWYLNEEKREYEKLFTFERPDNQMLDGYEVINGKLILFCYDDTSSESIYEYKNGQYEKLNMDETFDEENSYPQYYYENGFLYDGGESDFFDDVSKWILYRYDVNKRKTVAAYDFGKIKVDGSEGLKGYDHNSVITDNYMYIGVSEYNNEGALSRYYRVNLNDMTADYIFETNESVCINAVGDCAYIGFNEERKGLYKITPDSSELIELCSESVDKIYIVDDEWIYFSYFNDDIKRIRQDGEGLETAIKVKTANR